MNTTTNPVIAAVADASGEILALEPRTAPRNFATLHALISRWEARSRDALPADAMLVNKHIRELREALADAGNAR